MFEKSLILCTPLDCFLMKKWKISKLIRFIRYYLWNSICFFGVSMAGALVVNILVVTVSDISENTIGPDVPFIKPVQCYTSGDCTRSTH